MRYFSQVASTLIASVLATLVLFGCGNGSEGSGAGVTAAQIVGTWDQTSAMGKPVVEGGLRTSFEFKPEGKLVKTYTMGPEVKSADGSWSLDGSKLSMNVQGVSFDYNVEKMAGSKLELSMTGMKFEWTKR